MLICQVHPPAPRKPLYDQAQEVIMRPVPRDANHYGFELGKINDLIKIMDNSLAISRERSQAEERRKAAAAATTMQKIYRGRKGRLEAKERRKAAAEQAAKAAEERRKAAAERAAKAAEERRKAAAEQATKEAEEQAAKVTKSKSKVPPPARRKAAVAPPARSDNSKKRKPKKQLSAESKKKPKSTKAEVTGIQPRAAAQAQAEGVINPAAAEAEGAIAAAETAATQRPYPSQNRGEGTTAPVAKAARRDKKPNKKGGMSLLQYQTGGSNESYYLYQENLHLIIKRLLLKFKTDLEKRENVENLNYYSLTYDVCLKFLMIHERK